jgi:hypothetical protein
MSGHDTAKAVLAKASLGDSTIPKPDAGVLEFWAEQLVGIAVDEGVRAVTAHYAEEVRKIMPADVIKRVTAERKTRFDIGDFNAVPDADPDDVPAWLAALRAGRLVDESPKEPRPMGELVRSTLKSVSAS